MKIKQRAFPHPVVGNGDDVDAGFQAPVQVYRRGDFFEIEIICQMNSESLRERIDSKEATFGIHIECSKSFFREMKMFKPRNGLASVKIPVTSLSGSVELNVVVFATKEITKYRIKGSHEDYGRKTFFISPGDFLAITEGHLFNADIHQDMLESVDSIMQIRVRPDNEKNVAIQLDNPKIVVLLPKEDFKNYALVRNDMTFQAVVISSIVLPVLMEALKLIATGDEDYESCRWYDNLVHRMAQKDLDAEGNPFENAQALLEMPLSRTLKSFCDHNNLDDDIED